MNNKKIFDYKKNKLWAENMQIVMQLGLTMVGCVGFCFYVGFQIDKWFGIKGLFVTIFYHPWRHRRSSGCLPPDHGNFRRRRQSKWNKLDKPKKNIVL